MIVSRDQLTFDQHLPNSSKKMLDGVLWIVIVGGMVMFCMAFGIGANDVANTLGTSIGSKVLTYRQAMVVAGLFEFAGAALMGAKVTDTISKKIVDLTVYETQPELLMVVMLSALFGGAIWLIIASALRLPVSTTHTMVGAVIGGSLAASGTSGVNGMQIGFVVLSWVVSPVASGIISALLFLFVRHVILRSKHPLKRGYWLLPVIYGITMFINVFFIIYKGSPGLGLKNLELWLGMVISLSVGAGVALVVIYPGLPLLRKYIYWKERTVYAHYNDKHPEVDLTFKMKENDPTPKLKLVNIENGERVRIDQDETVDILYEIRRGNIKNKKSCWGRFQLYWLSQNNFLEKTETPIDDSSAPVDDDATPPDTCATTVVVPLETDEDLSNMTCGKRSIMCLKNGYKKFHNLLDRLQGIERSLEVRDNAERFHFKTETLFSVLQVLTACFASFAHGANDVANAVAPFAAIFAIYSSGVVTSKSDVPVWILVTGGVGIVVGLVVWGYRVIETVGQNLVKISPSRGFSIELGAALTIVTASYLGFPVSTTHSLVGSVVAIGLTEGIKQVNGRLLLGIVLSWLFTLPFAGGMAALFVVIIRNGMGI